MKRVCTLRKVLPLGFKDPLRKVIFYRSYIVAFYRHSVLIVLKYHGFLSPLSSYRSLEYLQPGDFSCCKYKYIFRNLQVFEHFFSKKG